MKDILRPILELSVVLPGLLLAYFPVKSYLKQSPGKLAARILPLMAGLCIGAGIVCYQLHASTASALAGITLLAIGLYTGTLQISLWKSGTIALTVCAVFACINSLSRAISVMIALHMQLPQDEPWFCLAACVFYNVVCWILVLTAFYPSTHAVRVMVEDDNFAQTWYVFWVLPLVFIFLNLFMIPRYQTTLRTGRVLQGYIVISIALLLLLLLFNAIFLLMATSLNRNARLQQENQLLFLQQQRYENLKTAIEEVRQARHDMRHHLSIILTQLQNGHPDKAQEYIHEINSAYDDTIIAAYSGNEMLNSVLSIYHSRFTDRGLSLICNVSTGKELPCSDLSLCTILSNALENSMHALEQLESPSKWARLTLSQKKNHILFQLENPVEKIPTFVDGVPVSTRNGHGIGVRSIIYYVEQLHGQCHFSIVDHCFVLRITI